MWNLRKRLDRALTHRRRKLLPRLVLADPCNGLPTPPNLTAELDSDRINLRFQTLPGNPNDYGDAYYSNNGPGVPPGVDPTNHLAMVDVPAGASGVAAFQFEQDVPLNVGQALGVRSASPSGAGGAKSNTVGMEVFAGF